MITNLDTAIPTKDALVWGSVFAFFFFFSTLQYVLQKTLGIPKHNKSFHFLLVQGSWGKKQDTDFVQDSQQLLKNMENICLQVILLSIVRNSHIKRK